MRQEPGSRSIQTTGFVKVQTLLAMPHHHGVSRSLSNLFLRLKIITHVQTNVNIFLTCLRKPPSCWVSRFSLQVNWQITKATQLQLLETFHHRQAIVTTGDIWLWVPKWLCVERLESLTALWFQKTKRGQNLREGWELKNSGWITPKRPTHLEGHSCGFLRKVL